MWPPVETIRGPQHYSMNIPFPDLTRNLMPAVDFSNQPKKTFKGQKDLNINPILVF